MKGYIKKLYNLFTAFGIDPRKTIYTVRGLPCYLRDLVAFVRQGRSSNSDFPLGVIHPCLQERYAESGLAKGHYFHQDLWVAKKIFENTPERHVDIGSRIDGFVAHVAVFREIQLVDIRPLSSHVHNIKFLQADLMRDLRPQLVGYCDSVSCLHALEHFGLGRYGDDVQFDGHLLGWNNVEKILRKGGRLYFSTPIGPQRIEFNAHRVFSLRYLLKLFSPYYGVEQFCYVDDGGAFHENATLGEAEVSSNCGCYYGCGIFILRKL